MNEGTGVPRFQHSELPPPRFSPRADWLAEEKLTADKLEEIIDWVEKNRGSQWYGEAAIYVEDLLCDREARIR